VSTGRAFPTGVGAPALLDGLQDDREGATRPSSSTGLKHCSPVPRRSSRRCRRGRRWIHVVEAAGDHSDLPAEAVHGGEVVPRERQVGTDVVGCPYHAQHLVRRPCPRSRYFALAVRRQRGAETRTLPPVYGMSALDRAGRIADRAAIEALDWAPGTRLHLDPGRTHLTLRAAIDGTLTVKDHRYLYTQRPRLRGSARRYSWAVVTVAAGLSGLAVVPGDVGRGRVTTRPD
jgi:hypothetical protein